MSLLLRVQALAYAWLGLFYQEQPKGLGAARKCFQRALAIDPHLAIAGEAWPLSSLFSRAYLTLSCCCCITGLYGVRGPLLQATG